MSERRVAAAVLGGGPAGLMAAEVLAGHGVAVTVYDRMPTLGRKLLMAGRGGLNLTHSEPLPAFLGRYAVSSPRLRAAIEQFPPERLRAWCEILGQPTFVGSSGRVFPTAMKASPLLRAWLRRLGAQGVIFAARHRWTGWTTSGDLSFDTPDGPRVARTDAVVLAFGGASWPQLGSDGAWVQALERDGQVVAPLLPANCGFLVPWTALFRDRFEGEPLKNVSVQFGARRARGDLVITREGLEGGAIYALAADLRETIASAGTATLRIDLRPAAETAELAARLTGRASRESLSTRLRKGLSLAPTAIGLLHEAATRNGTSLGRSTPGELASLIRAVPVPLHGTAPLARAISTAGGLRFDALDDILMLRHRPGVFAAGEMLDWEAPTGGYLLQACFATGAAAARGALSWLNMRRGVQSGPANLAVSLDV